MLRFSFILAAMVLALGGCDRAREGEAQPTNAPQAAEGDDTTALAGVVSRDQAGEPLPEFTVTDPAGNTLDLASLEGRPVLLNLWATWCAPCVVEMPMLDALAQDMAGELRVVTVSQDIRGAEKVEPFFDERGFERLEPWLDPGSELAVRMSEGGQLPLTVLYDAQGREVLRIAGGYEWDGEEARALIGEALGG
ncbi:Thiol-disulfide isomerase or thioredoxin [Erythrobacter litoralis]|jgi:thiol-disulfide isomerase/thioredoxin|uniref:Thiol:disulfide interchange protein n=1 Tax=Erythrobacter litoralis TaxID=39960 RepID=A0A074MTI7_9SPHN|nr:TlpA disulfide reductase family protein [Erythrobacter litoralis]AOL24259.1 Thiol-disulfide isomerase or thioredoxin [Erythrobacter litoralis]KEO88957.1 thiol:disulfide interchange protein [Erythrobacter litoralis]MEE4339103.1 TlpA disulfide reductase family protein [Erythrobacter sp.]